jgi:hypothetical protein
MSLYSDNNHPKNEIKSKEPLTHLCCRRAGKKKNGGEIERQIERERTREGGKEGRGREDVL